MLKVSGVLYSLGLIITACAFGQAQEVPFETVLQTERGSAFINEELRDVPDFDLIVVENLDDVPNLIENLDDAQNTVGSETNATEIDLEGYILLIAYFGRKSTPGYQITIDKITQHNKRVIVNVNTVENPTPEPEETNPIHLVKVKRSDLLPRGTITFQLRRNGWQVASREYDIPKP
jgi:hypothetical protein